jgi:hypothetical protein
VKVSFSAPRASKRRAMQPVQLLSRQSLEGEFSEVRRETLSSLCLIGSKRILA